MPDTNFVSTEWLAEHLHDDTIRIVDIRGNVLPATEPPPHYYSHRAEYEQSHIPNAIFLDWTTDIVEPNSPTYDVLNADAYAELMSSRGIADEHTVIAYDDANGMFAARFCWTLKYYAHEEAYILNGGWQKWLAENRPTSDAMPQLPRATFTAQSQPHLRVDAEQILTPPQPQVLVDVRSPKEFAGQASRANRMGHIPNAVNIPRKTLVTDDGTLKSADELRKIITDAGVNLDTDYVVLYCNSGVSASYGLFALQQAGLKNGAVYDSSWKDWGNDDTKPIEA